MKTSVSVALEKVVKVYKSCTTTKQFVIANTYKKLFWDMYGDIIAKSRFAYSLGVRTLLDKTQADTLKQLKA